MPRTQFWSLCGSSGDWSSAFLIVFGSIIILCFVQSTSASVNDTSPVISALWVYPSFYETFGASFALDRRRVIVEEKLWSMGIFMKSTVLQNVSESECVTIVTGMLEARIQAGNPVDLWIVGYPLHVPCADAVAKDPRYANIPQFVAGAAKPQPMRTVIARNVFEARFIQGVACAKMAGPTGQVGWLAQTLSGNLDISHSFHGFVAGVRHVSPNITILTAVASPKYGYVSDMRGSDILLKNGARCISGSVAGLSPNIIAQERRIFSTALYPFARQLIGEYVLINLSVRWELVLPSLIADFVHFNKTNSTTSVSIANGTIAIGDKSTLLSDDARAEVNDVMVNFMEHEIEVFCTPHFDEPFFLSNPNYTYVNHRGAVCLNSLGKSRLAAKPPDHIQIVANFDIDSPFVFLYVHWRFPPAIVLGVLSGLLTLAALVGLASLLVYRTSPVYVHASPLFLFLILLGVLVGSISCFFWVGKPTNALCLVPWWLSCLALTLIYSCVLAKNWRVWRIFSSDNLRRVKVLDVDLVLKFVLTNMAVAIIILIIFTIYDAPKPDKSSGKPFLSYYEVQVMCNSKHRINPLMLGVKINYLLLSLASAFISFQTRKANVEYQESTSVTIATGISIIIQLLIIFITYTIPDNYLVSFYLLGYGNWALMVTAYGLFLPKFMAVHFSRARSSIGISTSDQPKLTTQVSAPQFDSNLGTFSNNHTTGSAAARTVSSMVD